METVIEKIEKLTLAHDKISPEVIKAKNIKLGLRNADGSGVVVGITTKGLVVGYEKIPGAKGREYDIKPIDGRLFYCAYDVSKMVEEFENQERFGFDEIIYLLLTGELPEPADLKSFSKELAKRRSLSRTERRILMEEYENDNQMYSLHSVISHMSRCDTRADSTDINDVSRQCINLIAKFPTIVANSYTVMKYRRGGDLKISRPRPGLSTAENFLYMLKGQIPDKYEAHLFDTAMILHAEHGGGNNSTFSVRTVSSSGANTYMAIASGIASLSGHLHGGANESVVMMMEKIKKNVKDWGSDRQIRSYINKLIQGKAGDRSGKVYGFGHAVYTLSDPRAAILKAHAEKFSKMKGSQDEFLLYDKVERIASEMLSERKNTPINSNVDYYSGFIYKLMGIPRELYTPIFAMARVVGWSAHRVEQIIQGKIIRPGYIPASVDELEYVKPENR